MVMHLKGRNSKKLSIMQTKLTRLHLAGISLLAILFFLSSCSRIDDHYAPSYEEEYCKSSDDAGRSSGEDDGPSSNVNTQAGIVTAGEWCDLTHWGFWSKLMLGEDFSAMSDYWSFYTNNRIAVRVTDERGNALPGVNVKLLREGEGAGTIWETITDNRGEAECWLGMFQQTSATSPKLRISLNGKTMDGNPQICPLDSLLQSALVNTYVLRRATAPVLQADIAFIVDATGSMADEISFLKQDLVDIIGKVKSVREDMTIRTAALFYRDEGDDYLTRHQNFTDDVRQTASFVRQQDADGGGDYPEAVHTALERMLQDLSWSETARTRIAFLVLDAPAHHESEVIRSLQSSIQGCARRGIKVIPVAASGVDKNTEFMLRYFADATCGTYVFLTDHSGVGNSHIAASVGDYEVEPLNNLLIRLIRYYTE